MESRTQYPMEGPEMANTSNTAKKAAAAPQGAQGQSTNTPPATDTPTPEKGPNVQASDEQAKAAKQAENAKVEVGPSPGTDEYAQQYKETFDQLAKPAEPVDAPEGTPEHEAYTPPEDK